MIIADTSGLYAALVDTEVHHRGARAALEDDPGPIVLSPFVLCELDYLLSTRTGLEAELGLLADVAAEAYDLAAFDSREVAGARALMERYSNLGIGLADASVVLLAERYETERLLTLDERHFRALRTSTGAHFTLLPADS
ncbi:MAG: PIN domain-containing protein [Actinobacteria bacterium]|nr:PIN domain-containing protein [Actinomycetota bacterium]